MTELQSSINSLKDAITSGNRLLFKLEKVQKDLDKSKIPEFPCRFTIVKDKTKANSFIIALPTPAYIWTTLPGGFTGRGGYSKDELQQIITRIQTLLGDK